MGLTAKDLRVINMALNYLHANAEGFDYEEFKQTFGNFEKTIMNTRSRVHKEMAKKEACI